MKTKNVIKNNEKIKVDFELSLMMTLIIIEKSPIMGRIIKTTNIKFEILISLKFSLYLIMIKKIPIKIGTNIQNFVKNIFTICFSIVYALCI